MCLKFFSFLVLGLYTGVQKYLQVSRGVNNFWNSVAAGTATGAHAKIFS